MEVEPHLHFFSHCLSHRSHALDGRPHRAFRVDVAHARARVHLELLVVGCGEDACRLGRRLRGRVVIPSAPAVDLESRSDCATEQRVDWHSEALTKDVPQRFVDAGECALEHRPTRVEFLLHELLVDVLDS